MGLGEGLKAENDKKMKIDRIGLKWKVEH